MKTIPQFRATRLRLIAAAGAAAAVGICISLVISFSGQSHPAATITEISRNFKVCLLTTGRSAAPVSGPVWTAIRAATRQTTAINAEQLTAPVGPPAQQIPYLGSLISLNCGLIVVAGPELRDALAVVARTSPAQRFLSYGAGAPFPNVRQIPDGATAAITAAVIGAAKGTPGSLVVVHR